MVQENVGVKETPSYKASNGSMLSIRSTAEPSREPGPERCSCLLVRAVPPEQKLLDTWIAGPEPQPATNICSDSFQLEERFDELR